MRPIRSGLAAFVTSIALRRGQRFPKSPKNYYDVGGLSGRVPFPNDLLCDLQHVNYNLPSVDTSVSRFIYDSSTSSRAMTKRKSYSSEHADSKRPRYDDNRPDGNRPGGHSNPQQRHNQSHGNTLKARDWSQHTKEHVPVFQDPMTSLEQLLKGITSNPEQAEKVLGAKAFKQSSKLLSQIEKRDKSSTLSLDVFQPDRDTKSLVPVPAYYAGTHLRTTPLPPLPVVPDGDLARAPFIHKSMPGYDRNVASGLNYESLEFLGDAYLEIFATRLIFSRFPTLSAGRQAQIREMLVKNETLLGYSQAYNFDARLQTTLLSEADQDTSRGNKAFGKILADVFEAYVAAVVLSDPEHGFARTEQWMAELWAPVLLQHFGPESEVALLGEYDPNAKAALQKRILANHNVKLEYLEDKPPVQETKQNLRFSIALYLTGWGYEKRLLGKGNGVSKIEAGNRAAMQALSQEKTLVEDCERQFNEVKERRRKEKEQEKLEKEAAEKTGEAVDKEEM